MSSTEIILLERVENLGEMGDVVTVKPGYARNFLMPQKKALRASKANVAYFEAQKKTLEAENEKKKKAAEKVAKKVAGVTVPLIRQASEAGQLFGSVATRDIAAALSEETGETVTRSMVNLNTNIKTIGLEPIEIILHPEVKVEITINIARSKEEAEIQAETGRALISDADESLEEIVAEEQERIEEEEAAETSEEEEPKAEAAEA